MTLNQIIGQGFDRGLESQFLRITKLTETIQVLLNQHLMSALTHVYEFSSPRTVLFPPHGFMVEHTPMLAFTSQKYRNEEVPDDVMSNKVMAIEHSVKTCVTFDALLRRSHTRTHLLTESSESTDHIH